MKILFALFIFLFLVILVLSIWKNVVVIKANKLNIQLLEAEKEAKRRGQ